MGIEIHKFIHKLSAQAGTNTDQGEVAEALGIDPTEVAISNRDNPGDFPGGTFAALQRWLERQTVLEDDKLMRMLQRVMYKTENNKARFIRAMDKYLKEGGKIKINIQDDMPDGAAGGTDQHGSDDSEVQEASSPKDWMKKLFGKWSKKEELMFLEFTIAKNIDLLPYKVAWTPRTMDALNPGVDKPPNIKIIIICNDFEKKPNYMPGYWSADVPAIYDTLKEFNIRHGDVVQCEETTPVPGDNVVCKKYNPFETVQFVQYNNVKFKDFKRDEKLKDVFATGDPPQGATGGAPHKYDYIMCFFLSHGNLLSLQFLDGPVSVMDFTNLFNSKSQEGVPKLFFLQACQGPKLADVQPAGGDFPPAPIDFRAVLPKEADHFHFYATAFEHAAWVSNNQGSFFIQCLCQVLGKVRSERTDILTLGTQVIDLVTKSVYRAQVKDTFQQRAYKQVPMMVSRLRKPFYFSKE